jgi:hypothetical protein
LVVSQVIMLVQTDVTPRVELENKLADLTDAQLSMLEQLFPRHIIEYMLARVPSKGGRNLRDLANTHEQVGCLQQGGCLRTFREAVLEAIRVYEEHAG